MDEELRLWLDGEMQDYGVALKRFNRRLMKKVPLWMALSVAGMVALGFGVGYDWGYVLRVHLLIGVGFAAFLWLCFWLQTRGVSVKKARRQYEQCLGSLSPADQAAFARQGAQCGRVDFFNPASDKYPARLLIGPDYWLYFRGSCQVFRVADIQSLSAKQETARVGYSLGDTRVRQNLGVGVSLVAEYREGTAAAKSGPGKIFLEDAKQLDEARQLIRQYCPKAGRLFEKE